VLPRLRQPNRTHAPHTTSTASSSTQKMTPSTDVIAAIDQGTQSTRVFLFDGKGEVVASHQVALKQILPKAG